MAEPTRSRRLFTLVALLPLAAAGEARAQTQIYPPAKVIDLRETNAALEELNYFPMLGIPGDTYHARMSLGDGMNLFGSETYAEAYVDDRGTFWAEVVADNNNPPYRDWGHGEASTTLQYSMHKEEGPAEMTLHVTGGRLSMGDYGGGTQSLEAFLLLDVYILPDLPIEPYHIGYFAALSGRGGTPDTETFDWGAEGLDVSDANYTEIVSNGSVTEARLDIPAQTLRYELELMCSVCDFRFVVVLSVIARNPGGETYATAYFRDPVEFGGSDPALGGAAIAYEGVTVLPSPEPAASAGAAAGLAALALAARVRRQVAVRSRS